MLDAVTTEEEGRGRSRMHFMEKLIAPNLFGPNRPRTGKVRHDKVAQRGPSLRYTIPEWDREVVVLISPCEFMVKLDQ